MSEEINNTTNTIIPNNLVGPNDSLVVAIQPAQFDNLLKVLNIFATDKNTNAIIINNSVILQYSYGAILKTDISDVFDGVKVNFHIIDPKKYMSLLKNLKSKKEIVYVIDNMFNNTYTVTNRISRFTLSKQSERVSSSTTMNIPDLNNIRNVCEIKINKNQGKEISTMMKESSKRYVSLLLQDNIFKGVEIPEIGTYIFEQYIDDHNITQLFNGNADIILKTSSFLSIDAEEYLIRIGLQPDNTYCSFTECDTGFIKVEIFEFLDLSTGDNILG